MTTTTTSSVTVTSIATTLLSSLVTQNDSLLTTTTMENVLNTTTVKHRGILNQLFLQTIGCQIITGFFAWAALCITVHHVMHNNNKSPFYSSSFKENTYFSHKQKSWRKLSKSHRIWDPHFRIVKNPKSHNSFLCEFLTVLAKKKQKIIIMNLPLLGKNGGGNSPKIKKKSHVIFVIFTCDFWKSHVKLVFWFCFVFHTNLDKNHEIFIRIFFIFMWKEYFC